MIKFFRKIRQNLLMENKTGKYLKYAIGEIVLVMIGILLALQVNNWNTNRMAKKIELNQIQQLLEDAKSDAVFFKSRSEFLTSTRSLQNLVLSMYIPKLQDSVIQLKRIDRSLFGSRLAYQSNVIINNKDALDILKNDSIKKHLKKYYAKYEYVAAAIDLSNRMSEEHGIPLYLKYSETMKKVLSDSLMRCYLQLIKHKDIQPNVEISQLMQQNSLEQVNEFNDEIIMFTQKLNDYLILNND